MPKWLAKVDVYAKPKQDYNVQTLTGACISLGSMLLMAYLLLSELQVYRTIDTVESLTIDRSEPHETLPIDFKVIFHKLCCVGLRVDAYDVSGEGQEDIHKNIRKTRISPAGEMLTEEPSKPKQQEAKCGSCYGAETHAHQCCNTCDEVKLAYRRRSWTFPGEEKIDQCMSGGLSPEVQAELGEGCLLEGKLSVNKVSGRFIVSAIKSLPPQMLADKTVGFDTSHTINLLSFGDMFPNKVNPLDHEQHLATNGTGSYKYFLRVVPTVYTRLDGSSVSTNQYEEA